MSSHPFQSGPRKFKKLKKQTQLKVHRRKAQSIIVGSMDPIQYVSMESSHPIACVYPKSKMTEGGDFVPARKGFDKLEIKVYIHSCDSINDSTLHQGNRRFREEEKRKITEELWKIFSELRVVTDEVKEKELRWRHKIKGYNEYCLLQYQR